MYALGDGLLSTQCAAVRIQSGLIRDPPQMCLPLTRRDICHGQEWGLAFWPFTTRAKGGRIPHPKIDKLLQLCGSSASLYYLIYHDKASKSDEVSVYALKWSSRILLKLGHNCSFETDFKNQLITAASAVHSWDMRCSDSLKSAPKQPSFIK